MATKRQEMVMETNDKVSNYTMAKNRTLCYT